MGSSRAEEASHICQQGINLVQVSCPLHQHRGGGDATIYTLYTSLHLWLQRHAGSLPTI